MIMTNVQLPGNVSSDEVASKRKTIKRQPMQDRSKPVAYVVDQEKYDGPKKPPMPLEQSGEVRWSQEAPDATRTIRRRTMVPRSPRCH